MNEKIKQYREEHPNCEYCYWYHYNCKGWIYNVPSYEECILKSKIIRFKIKAKFCKYYEVKEREE